MLFVSFVFTSWRNTAVSGRQRQPVLHLRRKPCHPSPEHVSEHVCFDKFLSQCICSAVLFLMLKYGKNKFSTSHIVAGSLFFSLFSLFLILPGLALRFPALSALRNSAGAPDAVITALFAANTPIAVMSRAKTILVIICITVLFCPLFCNLSTLLAGAFAARCCGQLRHYHLLPPSALRCSKAVPSPPRQ